MMQFASETHEINAKPPVGTKHHRRESVVEARFGTERRLNLLADHNGSSMSITLELDEQALAGLPLGPGERERHIQIELACRFYARGWLSLAQASRLAKLDRFALGVALAERGIPRRYTNADLEADLTYAGGVRFTTNR